MAHDVLVAGMPFVLLALRVAVQDNLVLDRRDGLGETVCLEKLNRFFHKADSTGRERQCRVRLVHKTTAK